MISRLQAWLWTLTLITTTLSVNILLSKTKLERSPKIQLWAPKQPVCILVHNPLKEPIELPEPYTPPSVNELFGPGVTEANMLYQQRPNVRLKTMVGDNVTLVVTYGDGANEGFNHPNLGAARRAAFEFAMDIWADNLQGPATISINATMTPRGGTATNATLASAAPAQFWENFTNAPIANTFYPEALTEIISNDDPDGNTLDINVDFNSDVDNGTVLGNINWYYGLDANPGTNIDFVTVSIHEICHGLGFSPSFNNDGTFGVGTSGDPTIYDRFLVNGNGTQLITLTSSPNNLTGNNVFWNGLKGRFAFNNDFGGTGNVPVFAPNNFQGGSSISHLDETTFTQDWDLMTPNYDDPNHTPDTIVMGMLQDIGYSLPNSRYVKINATGFEDGSSANPFDMLIEGVNDVPDDGIVRILPGNYDELLTIDRPMQLRSCGGVAIIGSGTTSLELSTRESKESMSVETSK